MQQLGPRQQASELVKYEQTMEKVVCFTHKGPVVLVVGPVLQIAMDTGLHQWGCSYLDTTSKFLSRAEG